MFQAQIITIKQQYVLTFSNDYLIFNSSFIVYEIINMAA